MAPLSAHSSTGPGADVDVAVDDDRCRADLAVALELPAGGQGAAVPLLEDTVVDEVALAAVEGRGGRPPRDLVGAADLPVAGVEDRGGHPGVVADPDTAVGEDGVRPPPPEQSVSWCQTGLPDLGSKAYVCSQA